MSASTLRKAKGRFFVIALNALLQMATPMMNVVAAWWVIHFASEDLWGAFVDPLIFTGLALHILNWGNKEFLLRAFAMRPDAIPVLWKQALVSRGMLLFIVLPLLLLAELGWEETGYLLTWIFAGFFKQSFDVAVTYARDFGKALLVELGAAAILFGGLYLSGPQLTLLHLMKFFALSQVWRAVIFAAIYGKSYLAGPYPRIQFRFFRVALPFFLLGFAGMLGTRVDLICVSIWMDDASAGRYQVAINLLIWVQAGAGFLLYPFVKNIYRLPDKSLKKLATRVFLGGLGITALAIPAVWAATYYVFGIDLGAEFHLLSAFFILPVYFYTTYIFLLYKHRRQQQVLLANAGGIMINIGLNIVLIPSLGLTGALLGTIGSQLFIMLMVLVYTQQIPQKPA